MLGRWRRRTQGGERGKEEWIDPPGGREMKKKKRRGERDKQRGG